MRETVRLVVFRLDGQRYALRLEVTGTVLRAVKVAVLATAPPIVRGVINMRGEVIPVVDVRRRLGLAAREIELTDRFVIARTPTRTVAIICDSAEGIVERSALDVVPVRQILPGARYVEGVAKYEDGLIVIQDLDKFLSLEEEQALEQALQPVRDGVHHA